MTAPETRVNESYDVVICGGGQAGLTLARQLRIQHPDWKVALADRQKRPLPDAAHKVGESSIEGGAYYLSRVCQLFEYMRENHLPKFGLRFFFGDTCGPVAQRPELGLRQRLPFPSYQIDRGRFENDLRDMNVKAGVAMHEGYNLVDIELNEADGPHKVVLEEVDSGKTKTLECRWVVDASGRRRFLQSKLGLKKPNGHLASATWWRLRGEQDLESLVPKTETDWHSRLKERRWLSTNHLMGKGYWVWVIPLSTGNTSIGIVTDEKIHPIKTYNTYELSKQWLWKHEPVLAAKICHMEPMDFLALKHFSYTSRQIFSKQRWACVGVAGIFADPFYSVGLDFIGIANQVATRIMELEFKGELTQGIVDEMNDLVLNQLAEHAFQNYRDVMGTWQSSHVGILKIWWDTLVYFTLTLPLHYYNVLDRVELLREFNQRYLPERVLNGRMQRMFVLWAERTRMKHPGGFVDYSHLFSRWMMRLFTRPRVEQTFADWQDRMNFVEELAVTLFEQALKETMPEKLAEFPDPFWVNAWAISLDPEKWEEDGLFKPESKPRDIQHMREAIAPVPSACVDAGEAVGVA